MADSINVETGELTNFAQKVRSETEGVFQPTVNRQSMPLQDGVTFGLANASGAVHAAKQRYAQSLIAATANVTEFIRAAQVMAAAAEKVAAEFDTVDKNSADSIKRVNDLLYTAAAQADAARLAANPPQVYGPPQDGPHGAARAI
jgi:hypothetical protein